MKTFTVHAAKTQLSKLIAMAEAGEEIIIAKGAKPVVRLVALSAEGAPRRVFGSMKGKAVVTEEFFEPLSESELGGWEG